MDPTPWWLALLVAGIPAIAAVAAAVIAARAAHRARTAEAEAHRLRDLEARLADKKYEVYRPMLQMLGDVLLAGAKKKTQISTQKVGDFSQWISIYGSDEAVIAFQRFMQAAYDEPPGEISIRLYAEFVLAARRDIGIPDTELTAVETMGLRLTDIYRRLDVYDILTLPFDDLCEKHNWQPPWKRTREEIDKLSKASTADLSSIDVQLDASNHQQ